MRSEERLKNPRKTGDGEREREIRMNNSYSIHIHRTVCIYLFYAVLCCLLMLRHGMDGNGKGIQPQGDVRCCCRLYIFRLTPLRVYFPYSVQLSVLYFKRRGRGCVRNEWFEGGWDGERGDIFGVVVVGWPERAAFFGMAVGLGGKKKRRSKIKKKLGEFCARSREGWGSFFLGREKIHLIKLYRARYDIFFLHSGKILYTRSMVKMWKDIFEQTVRRRWKWKGRIIVWRRTGWWEAKRGWNGRILHKFRICYGKTFLEPSPRFDAGDDDVCWKFHFQFFLSLSPFWEKKEAKGCHEEAAVVVWATCKNELKKLTRCLVATRADKSEIEDFLGMRHSWMYCAACWVWIDLPQASRFHHD